MKLSITKEQYDELVAEKNPCVQLSIESQYFMTVLHRPKSLSGRRSPVSLVGLHPDWASVELTGVKRKLAMSRLAQILKSRSIKSRALAKALAREMKVSTSDASGYIGELLKDGALRIDE